MGRVLLIDVVASVAALGTWYVVFSHYNHKKGAAALRWVQTACAGKGRIVESRWMGTSHLQARLHFPLAGLKMSESLSISGPALFPFSG